MLLPPIFLWLFLFPRALTPPDRTVHVDETRSYSDPTTPDATRKNQWRQRTGAGHITTAPGSIKITL